jgi:hypothetical protein
MSSEITVWDNSSFSPGDVVQIHTGHGPKPTYCKVESVKPFCLVVSRLSWLAVMWSRIKWCFRYIWDWLIGLFPKPEEIEPKYDEELD